jgi:hypothetical protein
MTAIKRIALATIALAVALVLVNPASALASPAAPAVPFQSSSSGPTTFNPATHTVTGAESGVATDLGKFTATLVGDGSLTGSLTGPLSGITVAAKGTLTLVAANGDQLTGDFVTTGTVEKQQSVVTITGGTGRFAHATGTITVICITVGTHVVNDTLVIDRECTGKGELRF